MKKTLLCLAITLTMLAALIAPAAKVSAAEKKTAPNGITALKENFYNAVISAAKNGTLAKIHAESDEGANVEVKATRFAIAGSDGTNPYLLVTAYDPDDKSGWCSEGMLAETTYVYSYDIETGSFREAGIKLSGYARNHGMNDGYSRENLYLDNRSTKYDFAVFTVEYSRYRDGETCTLTEYGKSDKSGHSFEATKKTVSNYVKKGTLTKIKWYKLSSTTAFKNAYKDIVEESVKKGAKDDRDTYYAKKGSALYYLNYKIENGTMERIKRGPSDYEYVFTGVTEQDKWKVDDNISGLLYKSDGASTAEYYYYYVIDGKKVAELWLVTSYNVEKHKHEISVRKLPCDSLDEYDRNELIDWYIDDYEMMNKDEKKKIDAMSDVQLIKYLMKNYVKK